MLLTLSLQAVSSTGGNPIARLSPQPLGPWDVAMLVHQLVGTGAKTSCNLQRGQVCSGRLETASLGVCLVMGGGVQAFMSISCSCGVPDRLTGACQLKCICTMWRLDEKACCSRMSSCHSGWNELSDLWSIGCIVSELYTGELLLLGLESFGPHPQPTRS